MSYEENNMESRREISRALSRISNHMEEANKLTKDRDDLNAVKDNWENIKYIKNPSDLCKITAVRADQNALGHILPSNDIEFESVKKWPCSIKFIKWPSEELQILAVKKDAGALQYIKEQTETAQLWALKMHNGSAFNYITNPSDKVKAAIHFIKNPNEHPPRSPLDFSGNV